MFKLENVYLLRKKRGSLDFDGSSLSQIVGKGISKRLLEEYFASICTIWQEVNKKTVFKKSILERLNLSEVKMSRGSPDSK